MVTQVSFEVGGRVVVGGVELDVGGAEVVVIQAKALVRNAKIVNVWRYILMYSSCLLADSNECV
jgi:hypothetical protein